MMDHIIACGLGALIGLVLLCALAWAARRCRHVYGTVSAGYQYCTQCGAARTVPCQHQWTTVKDGTYARPGTGVKYATWYLQRCQLCGALDEKKFY